MLTNDHGEPERRHHVRVSARGAVVVRAAGREIRGRAVVVGGMMLEVTCPPGVSLLALAGAAVEVEMRLDGAVGTWFVAHGQIARLRPASHSVVIVLDTLPAPLAALIAADDRAAASGERRVLVEVIVVDRDPARRSRLAEAFRAEGCHVIDVGTTLEALDALAVTRSATDLIAVADTARESDALDLRTYLDAAHGSSLIVRIGEAEWTPTRARIDPDADDEVLRAQIQAVLQQHADDAAG